MNIYHVFKTVVIANIKKNANSLAILALEGNDDRSTKMKKNALNKREKNKRRNVETRRKTTIFYLNLTFRFRSKIEVCRANVKELFKFFSFSVVCSQYRFLFVIDFLTHDKLKLNIISIFIDHVYRKIINNSQN